MMSGRDKLSRSLLPLSEVIGQLRVRKSALQRVALTAVPMAPSKIRCAWMRCLSGACAAVW